MQGGMMMTSLRRQAARRAALPDATALLAALPNPVLALDRDATVRFLNPATEQLLGASAAALSGPRGGAEVVEQDSDVAERQLTQLLGADTHRIADLVDRMEACSGHAPIARDEVNIHEVLDRVRKIPQSGFARHLRLTEEYDP